MIFEKLNELLVVIFLKIVMLISEESIELRDLFDKNMPEFIQL
jgi:hypothetical protein